MEGSDALIPNVKALLLYRKCDGLVTSRGPDLHGRLEREREREREQERIGNVLFTSQPPVLLHSATLIPVVLTVKLTHPHNTTNSPS